MTGIEIFLEVLAGAGVANVFGNPGTTELPLNDALVRDRRFRYWFGVHEVPVVAMADGFALASGKLGVVNVHVSCGLGNAMGMLYNAHIEGSPLLLTAGQQDRRLRLGGPVLEGDLVRVAAPWTKWAYEVPRVEDMAVAVRRAVQVALTPPTGPVFLSLPLDVQMEGHPGGGEGIDVRPPSVLDARVRPSREGLAAAAKLLREARRPVILAGSRVPEADACAELTAVAERLGAPVFTENGTSHGRLPMVPGHPLYRGPLPLWSDEIRSRLEEFDVALAVGLRVLRLYIHRDPAEPLPPTLRLVQLDSSPDELSRNVPAEVCLLGDPKSGLGELRELLGPGDAAERVRHYAAVREAERSQLVAQIEARRSERPVAPAVLMHALARALPADVAYVDETATTHQNVFERLGVLRDPKAYIAHRGWALGWGLGCALGVKIAWPDRPVLALVGDGAALYGAQALYTAAHHKLPVVYVIANNAQYKILKDCGRVLGLAGLSDPSCPGLDLGRGAVHYVGLARSLGVEGHHVEEPDELTERVRAALAGDRPVLFEVPVGE